MTVTMGDATAVVRADLGRLVEELAEEFVAMSGRRLVITGGAGFLGYYLVQAPLTWNDAADEAPIEVTAVDNFFRGAPAWLSGLADRPDLELVEHDMRVPLPADDRSVSYVIHAAGIASPNIYRQYPLETMDANVNGLRQLLELAAAQGERGEPVSGFLFLSSSEIYGDPVPEAIPTPETYRGNVSCTGPRACYDESKRYGETLSTVFARTRNVPVTIARPFNNYGPGMKITDGRAVADFCRAVTEDRDIVMFSDGSPTRTLCYAADAVSGYYRALIHGRAGEPYNIGTDAPEISMADLAEEVRSIGNELFGYEGRVVLGRSQDADYLVDNPNRRCPAIGKATGELGFRPQVGLEEGLRRTLLWYRENRWGEER